MVSPSEPSSPSDPAALLQQLRQDPNFIALDFVDRNGQVISRALPPASLEVVGGSEADISPALPPDPPLPSPIAGALAAEIVNNAPQIIPVWPINRSALPTADRNLNSITESANDLQISPAPAPAPRPPPPEYSKADPNPSPNPNEDPEAAPSRKNLFRFIMAFVALAVVAFTSALDATILAVALPVVAENLKMTSLEAFWAGISFLLSSVIFQPVHTAMSDIFGRKAILYLCIGFFCTGAIVVGAAKNAGMLIAGRTIQGVGGGGIEALSEVILTDITTLKQRPFYIGILGLCWAAGSILGPIIGGVFAEHSAWRWIAWVNLPLMTVGLFLIAVFLKLAVDESSIKSKLKRVDYIGIALLMGGMTSFVLALCWGGQLYPWKSWKTLFPLILGLVLLGILGQYEKYPKEPIFNYRLFTTWTSSMAFFGSFIQGILIWVLVYYLVLYFQGAKQHQPFQSAIDALPLMFTLTPSAVLCAVFIAIKRRYLCTLWAGWLLCTVGFGTMILLDTNSSKAVYCGVQIAPGLGSGILLSALAIPLQASMSVDDAGTAMGMQVFFRAVGALVGVALGSSIFANDFTAAAKRIELPPNVTLPDAQDAVKFLTTISRLDISVETKSKLLHLYAGPVRLIWIVATGLSGIGLLSTFFMRELTLEREEMGRQALQVPSKTEEEEDLTYGSDGP